jgi:hypothetical protein
MPFALAMGRAAIAGVEFRFVRTLAGTLLQDSEHSETTEVTELHGGTGHQD